MPPPTWCASCGEKWEAGGGGLCAVCRSVDRLAATVRGPQLPSASGSEVLRLLREWIGELQDLGEQYRGVLPDPLGNLPETSEGDPAAPSTTTSKNSAPAATAKVKPTPERERSTGARETPGRTEGAPLPEEERTPRKKDKHPKSKRRDRSDAPEPRERKRRAEDRDHHREHRSSGSRPSRPTEADRLEEVYVEEEEEDFKEEDEEEASPEERRERKAAPRDERGGAARFTRPRPPSRSLPAHLRERGRQPDRPGRTWRGPIPGHRREPRPGFGRHFGKNKGDGKRIKNENYWRRKRAEWRR